MPTQDRIALDRASVRTIDQDGHLHVAESNISRAAVNGYLGSEIPDGEALGLQPGRVYQLLRDPEELERAAASFNGKPLLIVHKPQTAADHDHELTVGAVANPRWEAPYLKAELSVWDAAAIAAINSGEQKELSSAYRYRADMTPGTYDGVPYDGVMRDIAANHVALVESGRAGSDVVVGDAALPKEKPRMAALSRTALLTSGALRTYLIPKMAKDQKMIDLRPIVGGITAKNWKAEKAKLKIALDAALAGKLAKDADLEDVIDVLETLDEVVEAAGPDLEDKVAPAADEGLTPEEEAQYQALLKRRKPDDVTHVVPDEDKDEKDKDKPAMDAISKVAMDRAIAAAVAKTRTDTESATIARMRAIQEAERTVRPYVGEVHLAQDSAAAVYKFALDHLKVDVDGVDPSAYRAILIAQPVPGAEPVGVRRIGMDAAAAKDLQTRFPGMARLKLR